MTFKPTEQQNNIVNLVRDHDMVKVNAGAGAAKTSTLELVSADQKVKSLYLAYNRKMADEAREKFPSHVDCMTTHSLAYRRIGKTLAHKLNRPKGRYVNVAGTGGEIATFFRIPDFPVTDEKEVMKSYIGLIIRDTVNKFEYSSSDKLTKDHIPTYHREDIKKRYEELNWKKFSNLILRYSKKLWEERTDLLSEVLSTHDTYLKLFQLKKYKLTDYYIIYMDEGQDANDCTLDIFLNQKDTSKLVLVGDKFQQIYQWRGSVNAISKVDAEEGLLSKSFRFGNEVASVATAILDGEMELEGNGDISSVVGFEDVVDTDKPYTILYRTNMNLLFDALDLLKKGESVNVNFDTSDFTKMVKSAVELYKGNPKKVKHEDIIPYSTWSDFQEEAKSNPEFSRISSIIASGDDERVISILHNYRSTGREKITLITAHRSKGLEWDQVKLSDDFPSIYDKKGKFIGLSEADRNLLYVASTRAKLNLEYNTVVRDILELKNTKSSKNQGLGINVSGVQLFDKNTPDVEINNFIPEYCPRGEGATDALNRGLGEYVDEEYEYDMPYTREDLRKEIFSLSKDLDLN